MSMEHKAYVFDWDAFHDELSGTLYAALATGDAEPLVAYINARIGRIRDPYEGELLTDSWEGMVKIKDAHTYGDFAVTKFYDPGDNIGLGYQWQAIEHLLSSELRDASLI